MKFPFCLLITLFFTQLCISQQKEVYPWSVDVDYFNGSILEHNPDISHLIRDHPTGIVLSWNRKTYGYNDWEARYNFPDWGVTFSYQDMHNPILGKNYGLYGHFNFYFWNRHIRIGVAQGIAYNTNPYHPDTNYENNAYGSTLLSSSLVKMHLVKENLFKGVGVHAGFGLIHYSNANLKAPNNSTNTLYFSVGMSYQPGGEYMPSQIPTGGWRNWSTNFAERIHYNFVFRTGMNEADVNGLGQFPFYTFSVFADKRINYKSTFTAGADLFLSLFLIDLIRYRKVAFPGDGLTGDEDYRRVGVFVGHELRFNRVAFVSQLGYYVYWPYEFENRVYNRLGIKRYILKDKLFASATVKAHWAKAEAVEFSIGFRL